MSFHLGCTDDVPECCRWFDKNFTNVTYPGSYNGTNTEHTYIDASVSTSPTRRAPISLMLGALSYS